LLPMISRRYPARSFRVCVCLQLMALVLFAHGSFKECLATSGGVIELPISSTGKIVYSKQSDLDLRIDTTWAGVHGYRPVTCMISARSPQTADRQILIRVLAGSFRTEQPAIVVEKEFELPAGELSATTRFLVPQYVEWRGVGCETFVDGIQDEELSLRQFPFASSQSGHNFAALLYDDADRVPWRMFRSIRGGPAEIFDSSTGELLHSWTEYSSLDVVVTTLADLKIDHARNPERFPELLKWVRAGGNLWVCSAGRQYQHVPEVEEYLGIASEAADDATDPAALIARGWRFPKVDNPTSDALDQYSQLYAPVEAAEIARITGDVEEEQRPDALQQETSRQWFAVRPVGMGTVTAFAMDHPDISRGEARELSWAITQSLLTDRLSWDIRHGNVPDQGNENFNDFLIPDVGAAPVTAFQVLLSLFVLGIGPVNYFFLKGRERLPLLLITVPAAAAVTTVLLLIYGFTSEGFGTMVRARSFTLLDQRADSAVCWSRLSYFAGMTPSEGLEFPRDTLVYPILPSLRLGDHREMRRYANQRRELHWLGSQRLVDGWLASRTPTQYLTITSRDTDKEIAIEVREKSVTATNRLGVGVQTLVVEGHDGQIFMGEKLADGASLELQPISQVKAMSALRTLLSDNEPQFPAGTLESLALGSGIDLLPFSRNLMETQISALTSAVSKGWGPGTYIAITDVAIDLSLGMSDIAEKSSFHVVRGLW
jgi:hypothetical protein